ncbi:unnamed protein product [Penicillium salamii]|uniref:Zn(2)-C6 fungal-type domain-containing protein n=1 Tax=Penicillium salamii TaxID=1612424 RepID=A0A9W4JE09_9EURO|nr:unnamed protein product [Penicillium salamii]CAG8384059.1 unnamed protein product [Penicillium salamii]CAG8386566.1 unnamed protein product [Penicillium salamii]CAG8400895.1 unnamed protein product [Penicillium salamii]
MVTRRSHNKSRHGCSSCKQRRVKCDEQRPTCGHCTQRQTECVYTAAGPYFFAGKQSRRARAADLSCTSNHSPQWEASLNHLQPAEEPTNSASLDMEQLELVFQWIQHTHKSLARNEETRKVWERVVLEEGLKAPFLMHGILALSALHLSCTRENEQSRWLGVAISHKNVALSLFSEQLSNINQSNAKAMMGFAGLVVMFGLGSALTPGTETGPSLGALIEIFTLSRGVQTVVNEEFRFLLESNFAPLFQATPPDVSTPDHVVDAFDHLIELNNRLDQDLDHHDSKCYEQSINLLRNLAAFTLAEPTTMTLVGGWAIRVSPEFLDALSCRDPFALVILAHFCGFLNMAHENWCIGPWGSLVLDEICQLLPQDWKHQVQWPVEQTLRIRTAQLNDPTTET